MSLRHLSRWLLGWLAVTIVACVAVRRAVALDVDETRPLVVIASIWSAGELVGRALLAHAGDSDARLDAALAAHPGATLVYESVVAEAPVVTRPEAALAMSFVPGRDGISATVGDRKVYVTPDDFLSKQGYDKGVSLPGIQLAIGLDMQLAAALLSEGLGLPPREVLSRATLRRIRTVRTVPGLPAPRTFTAETLSNADVRAAAIAAGNYLARGIDARGRLRYLVDAPSNRTLSGYDWPRHAGATCFLAQIAALSGEAVIAQAALRAARLLRDDALVSCGNYRCIGEGARADVGSTALTILAFVEVVRAKLDPNFAQSVPALAEFLRSQQRADGEFMHEYDRVENHPIDVQLLYYSGEAALALSRAHSLLRDPRDLEAATRAVEHLAGPAWSFFGSRYYWGEEHWTCQAMDDLWDRAPNRQALDFCLGWERYNRALQYGPGDTPMDGDGAYGFGPFVTPRLTPAGSRTEAAIDTLDAARRAGVDAAELEAIEHQIRRALALLMRHQLRPGLKHLFADPAAVEGAMPGSEVDWQLRIDYTQHAGSAMVKWLSLAP